MARKKSSGHRKIPKRQRQRMKSDVSPPASIQGVHTPCTSHPINSDAGCTRILRSSVALEEQKSCLSHPPAGTSGVSPAPSIQGLHSPCTSQPTNSDEGLTLGSFVALETHNNDGKPILNLDGQGFLPSRLAANGIVEILKRHFTDPWTTWKKIPISTRDMWFKEFLGKFSISPPDYNWAKRNFEMRGSVLMTSNLSKVRSTMDKPSWIKDVVWERLCEYWSSEGFKNKSTQAKTNRASYNGASHTGGSISASQHRANMMKETGVPPTPLELFRRTHQHKDNTWVDRRSQLLNETVTCTLEQLTKRAFAEGNPPPSELDVWCNVARTKKGKVFGLGMESKIVAGRPCCHASSSSSSMEWVKKGEFDELRKEIEGIRNERDELQTKVANTERLIKENNALIRQLMESMNHQAMPSVCHRGKSRRRG